MTTIESLNKFLATELVCYLRYMSHFYFASGIAGDTAKQEFKQHADDELGHMNQLAARICELGGSPDLSPVGLAERSSQKFGVPASVAEMVMDNKRAEEEAVRDYKAFLAQLEDDITTQNLIESIVAKEEEHRHDLALLLGNEKKEFAVSKRSMRFGK